MFITRKSLSRRAVLKGMGASVALPFLDAMTPAGSALAQSQRPIRLIALEMVHGAAGSTAFGIKNNLWAPAATGSAFDLGPTAMNDRRDASSYSARKRFTGQEYSENPARSGVRDPRLHFLLTYLM